MVKNLNSYSVYNYIKRKRLFAVSPLVILFLFSLVGKAQAASFAEASDVEAHSNPFFDICQRQIADYPLLKAEIDKRYSLGSDVSVLLPDIKKGFGKPISEKKVRDYLSITNKNEDTENSWFYSFNKACNYSPIYSMQWNIHILADVTKKITAINIRPIIETSDFSLTHVPFYFEYFTNDEDTQKALWNLTGTGTPKSKIQKLMAGIDGVYGDIETIKQRNQENLLVYRYRYNATTFIASRVAPWEFISIVIWEFNDQDRLIDLTVR
ncbi:hypothetical protein [Nitrosomonas ureae]|uniref:Uncharacterized protein n=1 Tax=Nitrosomonas ureae TaxID=44577 RepID=A0A1H9ES64_9PROT|nr:hypothetical protein [Nitrosomonas ureae]PTQ85827.1 hypothetical protein C8R28_10127 [Nitrosomonas ureae]SEQ28455.1 hypothetical protein SAMN05421510_10342 [Nitrosomonas ureae]